MVKVYEKNGKGEETSVFTYRYNGHVIARCSRELRVFKDKVYKPFCWFNSEIFRPNMPSKHAEYMKWCDKSYVEKAKGLPYEKEVKAIYDEFSSLGADISEYSCI